MARSYNTVWTGKQNKLFEEALAIYDRDTPDRWHNIAKAVGGNKTVEDIKRQYKILEEDVNRIESGKVPFPNYKLGTTTTTTPTPNGAAGRGTNPKGLICNNITKEEQRLKCLKLQ